MKRSLLVLTAALSFGLASAQTAAPASAPQVPALTDVPAGHWAKDAIDRLVSRGVILGYPDGTFRGTQNLTRYEAAIIIARLLDQIRAGEVAVMPEAPNGPALNAEDVAALQNAIQELAADLAALGVRVSDLEENAVSREDFSRLETRIEELTGKGGDTEAMGELQTQIDDLTARVDEYDTLRADVDDSASSIAALNDLTVLLNQDILDLQDRVSAVETAQADFVQRSEFTGLQDRVTSVETNVTNVSNRVEGVNASLVGRIAALERNAFSVKPSLTLGYSVSRANRNFDVDRLFPLNPDGTVPGNAFTTGGIDADTGAQRRDFGDFAGTAAPIVAGADGLYGFAAVAGPAYREGRTDIGISLGFDTSNQFRQVTSAGSGNLFTTAGRLSINQVDVNFGLVTDLPSTTYVDTNGNGKQDTGEATGRTQYPGSGGTTVIRDSAGNIYRPVFFRFKNATTEFSVGNNPVIVTLGAQQKFYFGDYVFDNNYDGRGDGYTVTVDGSNAPLIGAWRPVIKGVYGSRSGLDGTGEAGFGAYYRGVRAQITPAGSLTLGLNYAQEGLDAFGAQNTTSTPSDVTVYGADAHGKVFGVELHSEYAMSRVLPRGAATTAVQQESAFYARVATRRDNLTFDLNTPAAKFGNDTFGVQLYDLNYRRISAGYDSVAGISENGYGSYKPGTAQNIAYNPDNGVTAPFANLRLPTETSTTTDGTTTTTRAYNGAFIGQQGFGVKAAAYFGPVAIGGYYDASTGVNGDRANALLERGASARVTLGSLFSVRGDYNELQSARPQIYNANPTAAAPAGSQVVAPASVTRYAVQGDVLPGRGFSIGAYYRDVNVNGVRSSTDRGLLSRGYLASSFTAVGNDNSYRTGLRCNDNNFGTGTTDIDGVGGVLNPAVNLNENRSATCFTSYGAELAHAGNADNALIPNLFFRVGYSRVYTADLSTPAENDGSFGGSVTYGDARYDRKLGVANVRLAGAFSTSTTQLDTRPAGTRGAVGLIVRTDPLTGLPFNPQVNGQVGYYSSANGTGTNAYRATALKYGAGVVLNDFLLPDTKIGVRYDNYTATNRQYTPFDGSGTQGFFSDANLGGVKTNLNGVYLEGAYQDLVFSYGAYTLSQRNAQNVEVGNGMNNGQAARGQTFRISYRVSF